MSTKPSRRLSSFLDALAAGRRPGHLHAEPEDVELVRTALTLRAARPGDANPDAKFVSDLHRELQELAHSPEPSNVRRLTPGRTRAALIAVAASLALVGGTFVATDLSVHGPAATSALQVPPAKTLRTATFESAQGRVLGQIVVYRGHPSWVFMNVDDSHVSGAYTCQLQMANGSIVAAGDVPLHDGKGELAKTLHVDTSRLRGAEFLNSSGAVVASAVFD